jgi:hypothetical protein
VVRALAATHGLSWEKLLDIAAAKRIASGSFRQRLFLEYVDQPDFTVPPPAGPPPDSIPGAPLPGDPPPRG